MTGELLAPDVLLQNRTTSDGVPMLVVVVAAGSLSELDVRRAVARAREVLKDDPREVSHVEVVPDNEMVRARKKLRRALRKAGVR